MITPEIFLNLDNSVINISCFILEIYSTKKIKKLKYDELYLELKKILKKEQIDSMYILAIDFLFLLEKLRYCEESDELELIM